MKTNKLKLNLLKMRVKKFKESKQSFREEWDNNNQYISLQSLRGGEKRQKLCETPPNLIENSILYTKATNNNQEMYKENQITKKPSKPLKKKKS